MSTRNPTREEMRAYARQAAAQAPEFTPEQIVSLRQLLGIDRGVTALGTATARPASPAVANTPPTGTPTTESAPDATAGHQREAA